VVQRRQRHALSAGHGPLPDRARDRRLSRAGYRIGGSRLSRPITARDASSLDAPLENGPGGLRDAARTRSEKRGRGGYALVGTRQQEAWAGKRPADCERPTARCFGAAHQHGMTRARSPKADRGSRRCRSRASCDAPPTRVAARRLGLRGRPVAPLSALRLASLRAASGCHLVARCQKGQTGNERRRGPSGVIEGGHGIATPPQRLGRGRRRNSIGAAATSR